VSNVFPKYNDRYMEQNNLDQRQDFGGRISKKEKGQGFFSEIIKFTLLAVFLVLPFRIFIAEPFIVSGSSMEPSFQSGNYLIIDKLSYRLGDPKRGDAIVLRYPLDKSRFFIKRIIGLPEETITMTDGDVYISKNDGEKEEKIEEPYLKNKTVENFSVSLGEREYFVMGDNRPVSLDSRSWGVLERSFIKGKPVLRLLPITKAEVNPGK